MRVLAIMLWRDGDIDAVRCKLAEFRLKEAVIAELFSRGYAENVKLSPANSLAQMLFVGTR